MAIAFDAVGGGAAVSGGTTPSWTHTATGSNRVVLVGLSVGISGLASGRTRTVTYGGTPMTSLGAVESGTGSSGFGEMFYLLAPATGAQTVATTISGTVVDFVGSSVSYTGVGAVSAATTAHPASGAPSIAVPSAVGNFCVASFVSGTDIATPNQTQRVLNNSIVGTTAAANLLIQDAVGAATVTFSAASNADWWACHGVSMSPPSGNTGLFFSMF